MAEGEEEGGGEGVRGVVEPPGGILVHAEAEGAEVSERRFRSVGRAWARDVELSK